MTNTAKQALWSKLSDNTAFIPAFFHVTGTAETYYQLFVVNTDMQGFNIVKDGKSISTLYCIKQMIAEVNEKGYPDQFAGLFNMSAFAWHNVQMPLQPSPNCKQLNLSL